MHQSASRDSLVAVARPLYSQVRELLLERINRGEWATGAALPNEFALAAAFQVSIGTLRRAIEGLEDAGIVIRRQGRGTFIAGGLGQGRSDKVLALRTLGGEVPTFFPYDTKIVRKAATADEAKGLQCATGSAVFEVGQSLRMGTDTVGVERALVLQDRISDLDKLVMKGRDVKAVYADRGVTIGRVVDQISVEPADEGSAKALGRSLGTPLLCMRRASYGIDQRIIETRRSMFLPDFITYANVIDRP